MVDRISKPNYYCYYLSSFNRSQLQCLQSSMNMQKTLQMKRFVFVCAISVTNPDVVFIKIAYFVGVHASVHTCASLQSCMCAMLDLTHCSNLSDDTHLMLVTVHTYDLYIFFMALWTLSCCTLLELQLLFFVHIHAEFAFFGKWNNEPVKRKRKIK